MLAWEMDMQFVTRQRQRHVPGAMQKERGPVLKLNLRLAFIPPPVSLF